MLDTGLVKPASEIESPDLPPPDKEIVPSGPRGPRRDDEPTPLAEVLEHSPVAQMISGREKVQSKELASSEEQPPTHVQRLTQPRGLRPTPSGFRGEEGHYHAGIRLSRSLDKNVVAVQFSDDWRPSRDGLNPENQQLRDRGFNYNPMRSQWERVDREQPAENYQDAKVFVESLVKDRLAGQESGVRRA